MTILKTRRFTTLAMLTAVAIVLNIFESVYIGSAWPISPRFWPSRCSGERRWRS